MYSTIYFIVLNYMYLFGIQNVQITASTGEFKSYINKWTVFKTVHHNYLSQTPLAEKAFLNCTMQCYGISMEMVAISKLIHVNWKFIAVDFIAYYISSCIKFLNTHIIDTKDE